MRAASSDGRLGLLCPLRLEAERCFLCHSPTLRPWIAVRRVCTSGTAASSVEGLWSPIRARIAAKGHAKAHACISASFCTPTRRGSFSLRRGLNSDLALPQAEHHLLLSIPRFASKTTKATRLGRPRWSCYAASRLAHTPLCEGSDRAVRAARVGWRPPASRHRRGLCRFGKESVGVHGDQHSSMVDRVGG